MRNKTFLFVAVCSSIIIFGAPPKSLMQEWPWYGGDAGGNRYSSLTDINRGNVKDLKLVWEWKPGEKPIPGKSIRPGSLKARP